MRVLSLLACLLCAATTLGAAEPPPFTFARSTPEAQGVSSAAILDFAEAAGQQMDAIHSFMLVRHGRSSPKAGGRRLRPTTRTCFIR